MKKQFKLMLGDNMASLDTIPDNSIDSIVTDPPYGLSFMGKKWDYDVPSVEFWKKIYQKLKPGGHILSFGGTRTYHRMVVNIEDAGFEIRDQVMWLYGSGFPKSHNISKAIDKNYGMIDQSILDVKNKLKELYKLSGKSITTISKECGFNAGGYIKTECNKPDPWVNTLPSLEKWKIIAKVIGYNLDDMDSIFSEADREITGSKSSGLFNGGDGNSVGGTIVDKVNITKSNTPEGSKYEGWGTALKPANEPICVARKPLSEKTIADNVIKWGTGGINIDGCRIGSEVRTTPVGSNDDRNDETLFGLNKTTHHERVETTEGRFPANIILECICDKVIEGKKGEPFLYKGKEYNNKDLVEGRSVDFMKGSKADAPNNYNDSGDIHTNPDCVCYQLDEQSGVSTTKLNLNYKHNKTESDSDVFQSRGTYTPRDDKGGASRFFYVAKVSKKERNLGLDNFEETTSGGKGHGLDRRCSHCNTSMLKPEDCKCEKPDWITPLKKNTHPTLKPINLMTYLCRLITPEGGIVLDPFMGSGSTGISARLEGFRFIGMEQDKSYFEIAQARIEAYEEYRKLIK